MLVAFSLTPMGVEAGVADYIADAVKIIRESGLPNRSDSMYTMIEGEWDEVMNVIKQATDAVTPKAPRVQLIIKADLWPDMPNPLDGKIGFLEQRIADVASASPTELS
ncbi:MTH1187 family thiamine-binding protein [Streptomyces piniterrae]|uniref:MTH1187 family thiamine-binding protein n=1 Tax=Streptomyces piniterrae TaxID=2571125 RepID=A0A4U0MMJ6_9ACTN|nr:MTH1187 family thiamine-binding protein [Streptomyces piniterrae]TJZ41951.1 MTH1187 family thiamine-binding protein [Streptomyces piniterrae]